MEKLLPLIIVLAVILGIIGIAGSPFGGHESHRGVRLFWAGDYNF